MSSVRPLQLSLCVFIPPFLMLIVISFKKSYLSKLYCFHLCTPFAWILSDSFLPSFFFQIYFSVFYYRDFASAFWIWKQQVSRAIFLHHLQYSALSECQQSNRDLSTQLVYFERYRNASLFTLGETRKRLVMKHLKCAITLILYAMKPQHHAMLCHMTDSLHSWK